MTTAQHASPPTDDEECREAVWSYGGACKSCGIDECYRQGWDKSFVIADNRERVAKNGKNRGN